MSRKNSGAWTAIHSMCRMQELDEDDLYARSKMILNIYKGVCWSTIGRADCVAEDICCYCGTDLDGALIFLETFAPDVERERFESRVKSLFETRWMIELIDSAMMRVKEFPYGGDEYYEILSKCYLCRSRYTERDMLDILNMERSRFYDRKKEAIYVFGLSLWGGAIPKLKEFLKDNPVNDEIGICC